jgi:hypothetical protein
VAGVSRVVGVTAAAVTLPAVLVVLLVLFVARFVLHGDPPKAGNGSC